MDEEKQTKSLITVRIELFGTARTVCSRRHVDVELPERTRASEMAAALAEKCPEVLGKVVLEDASGLQKSFIFNLNGTSFVDGEEELALKPGDFILLFSSLAGG